MATESQAAQDALLDQTSFMVSPRIYRQFLTRLDAPPAPNKKLRRMMTAKAPWDQCAAIDQQRS
jgi:uncharacterized protein (DUF1778 family)